LKFLYICGDSFATEDKGYHNIVPWFELLKKDLGSEWSVINRSMVCASNLHIRLQIQSAIENQADFVIVLLTSCTRGEGRINYHIKNDRNIIDRFINIGKHDHHDREFGCYSYNSLDETCVFSPEQIDIMKDFRNEIFDLELSVYNNQFIIESGLNILKNRSISFVFDQGGFEHPKFSGSKKYYFQEFENYKSAFNLWSLVEHPMGHRPYFHIIDQSVHQQVAEYYLSRIQHCG
jgi:hypothetical protein